MTAPQSKTPSLVILNPAANRGKMQHFRNVVQPVAASNGAEYVESASARDASERARAAATAGRSVIVVGGDGAINEVVNGILAARVIVPLGIVPAGSGNDFAWNTLKLPHMLADAVRIAFTGTPAPADAGVANGRYFANSFSVGLDADVAKAAERLKRYPFMSGAALYYTSSLRQLFFAYRQCPSLTLEIDGECVTGPDLARHVIVAITNGPTYGGGFRINPTADYIDGVMDICAVRYMPRMRAVNLLPVVKRGEHDGQPEVRFFRAREVHITCPAGVNAQMDGELMRATEYTVRILPGALMVRR